MTRHSRIAFVLTFVIGLTASAEPPRPATNQSGTSWKSGTYQYDGAGNVYAIGTVANPNGDGVYTTYSYDAMSRLAAVNSTARNETYTYDVYGNMTRATARDGSRIDYSPNAANQLSGAGITYDAAGSLKTYGGETYSYDALGMVVTKDHDNTWHDLYVYTADGERIGAKVGDTWTWTLRDDAHNVLRQYQSSYSTPSQSWTWLEDYEYGPRGLVSAQRSSSDGGLRHFHLDHLGSIRLITGPYGVAVSQHDFSPFGVELTPQHQEATRDDPKQFTGHERDVLPAQLPNPERALDYMHARYYGAAMGRFLSVDPGRDWDSKQPQSWNLYAYVRNNPVGRIDPDGRVVELSQANNYQALEDFVVATLQRPGGRADFGQIANDPNFTQKLADGKITSEAKIQMDVRTTNTANFEGGRTTATFVLVNGKAVVNGANTTIDTARVKQWGPDRSGVTTADHELFHGNTVRTGGNPAADDLPTNATGPAETRGRSVAAQPPDLTKQQAQQLLQQMIQAGTVKIVP